MEHSPSLAQRRHDSARIKRNRARDLVLDGDTSARALGKHAATPAACSCPQCGNPRKYRHERTVQEQHFLAVSRDYLLAR